MNVDDLELELRKLPGVRSAGFTERDDVLLIQLQVSGDAPAANLPLQATRIAYRHSEKPVALEVVRWRVSCDARDQTVDATPTIDGALSTKAGIEPVAPPPPPPPVEPAEASTEASTEPPIEAPVAPAEAEPEPAAAPAPVIVHAREQRVRLLAVLTFPDTDELEVHLTFQGRRIIGRAVASNGILGVVEAMVDGLKVFVPRLEFSPSWARELDDERELHLVAVELLALDSRRLGIAAGASAIEAAARATLHALNRSISKHLAEDAPDDAA